MQVKQQLEEKILGAFPVAHLEVVNESNKHAVAPGSETHFKVIVVSEKFQGMSPVDRHRLIYGLCQTEMANGVHALALHTYSPTEWEKKGGALKSPPCVPKH